MNKIYFPSKNIEFFSILSLYILQTVDGFRSLGRSTTQARRTLSENEFKLTFVDKLIPSSEFVR